MEGRIGLYEAFSRTMRWISLLAGILVALLTPLTYWWVQWGEEQRRAELYGQEVAKRAAEVILRNPEHWKFNVAEFTKLFADAQNPLVRQIRIFDAEGRLLDRSNYGHQALLHRSGTAPIIDNNQVFGRVEIDRIFDPVAVTAAGLLGLFSLLGTGLALLLFHFPSTVVRHAERRADETLQRLDQGFQDQLAKELQLTKTLLEKDTLFLEVHHRVKNNMQIIISLINMRLRASNNAEAQDILLNIKTKVMAMAQVHDHLYNSPTMTQIDIGSYLKALVSGYSENFNRTETALELVVETDKLFLAIDHALPIGLMVCELVMNSQKHAFVGRSTGRITVSLKRAEEHSLILRVEDDGVGASAPPAPGGKSLGLRLVRALASQMGGEPQFGGGPGFQVWIVLKNVALAE